MSTYSTNTIPDTLRTFEQEGDAYKLTESLFVHYDDFSFTTEEFEDVDFWYENLGINIFPLHGVTNFTPEDTKHTTKQSLQDFPIKLNNGKYKHRVNFNWSLDRHNLLNDLSNQNLKVIYVSGRVLRATKSGNTVSGLTVSLIDLEKIAFDTGSNNGNSELFIELFDSNELNQNGYEVEVDWEPKKVNRRILNISLSFGEDSISMLIKHLSTKITGIESSDITITDVNNGDVSFSTFIPGDGVYVLSGFDKSMTTACINIQSTIYIGYKKFSFSYTVVVIRNMVLADGNNMTLANGSNVVLAKN